MFYVLLMKWSKALIKSLFAQRSSEDCGKHRHDQRAMIDVYGDGEDKFPSHECSPAYMGNGVLLVFKWRSFMHGYLL